ncbi:DUF3010 family protein [Enterovibrio nigricans]|uniref:DUF3010 domain-containing protein n=1 Tax=Enterovibrio nigricans DSM 22720 TaxID=1121868 RepID=A0A1T4UE34_9GAMM|nr:DUF3010 family protein [Enterovibrio nigricans]PKF50743.1 DUF3010 domain-containing protein [Enterovibrio nigricans]SKA50856.1 Protein of unknown function [Enterovibrio nigricans DSM 22720]
MRVCAVDFKSNEANICLLDLNQGLFDVPDCRARKFTISDAASTDQIRNFQSQFVKLMEDYKVDKIVIRERPMKGKFAGSAIGFKLEAALQLIETIDCEILTASAMKESLKRTPVLVSMKDVGLKQFQEHAFQTACAYLNK